jgi:WD40 repeat protein
LPGRCGTRATDSANKRSPVTAVAAWRDDACLVGHRDQAMRIWSVSKAGRLERGRRIVFDAHPSAVCGNAELLVTGLETGEVQVSAARGRKTGLVIAAHGATGLDLSPDGTVLATVGFDNSIAFFDTKSGVQLHRDEQPRRSIEQIALHPDGKSLILNELVRGHIHPAELPHLVALRGFTLDPNKQTWTVRGANVGDLAIAPGGQIAARVQRKRPGMTPALVVGFDPHTGKKIWENSRGVCSRLAFTLDGKGIFGAGDRTLSRRAAGDGETVWIQRVTGRAHLDPPTIVPDGKTVAVVCGKAVEIRKIDDGALLRALPGLHAVVFGGGGERAVIGGNGRMRVIEYHTGRVKSIWRMEDRVDLQTAMTPVGHVAGDSKLLWYAGSWRKDRLFVTDLAKKRTTLIREDPRMSSFALSPDRRHLAIGYLDCRAELHDVAALIAVAEKRGKVVNVVADTGPRLAPILGRLKHASAVRSIAVQPGSGHVACGGDFWRVVLWNPDTKKRVEELTVPGRRLAWSDDGRWLAHGNLSAITLTDRKLGEQVVLAKRTRAFLFAPGSGSVSYGDAGKWQRYNLSTRETRTVVEIPDLSIRSAAVSLDGSRVALVGAKGGIWLFARKNEQLTKLGESRLGSKGGGPFHVEFQPGNAAGTTLMYQHGSSILLYKDLEKSKSPTHLYRKLNISASTFTPDGERIVIGYPDGHVAVVDTDRGRVLRKWPAHRSDIYALAFDPEKKAMYSAGDEGFVLIWDATAMLAK